MPSRVKASRSRPLFVNFVAGALQTPARPVREHGSVNTWVPKSARFFFSVCIFVCFWSESAFSAPSTWFSRLKKASFCVFVSHFFVFAAFLPSSCLIEGQKSHFLTKKAAKNSPKGVLGGSRGKWPSAGARSAVPRDVRQLQSSFFRAPCSGLTSFASNRNGHRAIFQTLTCPERNPECMTEKPS